MTDISVGKLLNIWTIGEYKSVLHNKCEDNVRWCTQNDPIVKTLVRSLDRYGCDLYFGRHVVCKTCKGGHKGEYVASTNQAVCCQGLFKKKEKICPNLRRQLTFTFDRCRAKLDFQNLEHLTCTEIRAQNFSNCSVDDVTLWEYMTNDHKFCVKNNAAKSVMKYGKISKEEAMDVVDKVFDKCYYDFEPIGRIPRVTSVKNRTNAKLAFKEGVFYGYFENNSE